MVLALQAMRGIRFIAAVGMISDLAIRPTSNMRAARQTVSADVKLTLWGCG